ncbi:MAG: hypothetical protein HC852_02890 [Acaryochloridaceae cyanobacterium RU_4_10]|nr:hypothetical protein [Acaryochloridaceae cyanobacterium RU_4_10]
MSTKSSIAYGDNFHLYQEIFDTGAVYLELTDADFEVQSSSGQNRIQVRIPAEIWEIIRTKEIS